MEDRYNVECCDFIHAHEDIVEKVRGTMPGEDTLYDLTELFRIFADSTRYSPSFPHRDTIRGRS